jgi:beta-lactamase regulating signal transducer with metallopeptidase domain
MTGEFLWEMAWKSSLLSLGALGAVALLQGRSAADRAFVLRLAVGLLLVLPVAALIGPTLAVQRPPVLEALQAQTAPLAAPLDSQAARDGGPAVVAAALDSGAGTLVSGPHVLLAIYGLGVGAVLSHLVAGLLTLRRWTQGARPVWHPLWAAAYDRARLRSRVRRDVGLLSSAEVPEPLGWGLRRPVVLIDPGTLARDEQAEAVLGHEMAHVARGDWLALLLGRLMLALFWFNPLAWMLNRRMLEEAEAAADMQAVAQVDPALYAQSLLSMAVRPLLPGLPATPMAGSGIGRRIHAVLDDRARARRSGSVWTAIASATMLAAGLTIAVVELLPARPAVAKTVGTGAVATAPPASASPSTRLQTPLATSGPSADAVPPLVEAGDAALVAALAEADGSAPPAPPEPPAPPAPLIPGEPPAAPAPPRPPAPPADPDKAALWALGVSDDWMAEMAAAIAPARLDAGDAMDLKALGMTPARARDLKAAGVTCLEPDLLVELAALGVTPAYVRELAAAGYAGLSPEALVELKAVGVTGAFAEKARRNGRARSVDDLVELRVTGWKF